MNEDLFSRYGHLLRADGTNQLQRTLPALEPGYIRPDERSLRELIEYARALAAEIRFYNASGQPVGDWRALVEPLMADPATGRALSTGDLEAAIAARDDWPPHLALFLVFLRLFEHLQNDLNELPSRHLAHYYEKVLHLSRRSADPDDVHVIFELARNAQVTRLPAGTLLDGGKDEEGRPLPYAIRDDVTISPARVAEIRRLVAETDRRGNRRFFQSDAIAESEAASWPTFGAGQLELDPGRRFMEEARIGFALAAPILRLAEGERQVAVTLELRSTTGDLPSPQGLGFGLEVELTGEEGWLAPDSFTAALVEGSQPDRLTLELSLALSAAAGAVVPFDAELHGAGPVSDAPALRCTLLGEAGHYATLTGLVVEHGRVTVSAEGVRHLVVQNDDGPLSPDQPMAPFGSRPRLGSAFYVGSSEIFSKLLTSLSVNLEWQDIPEDLFDHYRAYFGTVDQSFEDGFNSEFKTSVELLYERNWQSLLTSQSLFGVIDVNQKEILATSSAFDGALPPGSYRAQPRLDELTGYSAQSKYGFLRLLLTAPDRPAEALVPFDAFGHKAFSRRYADQALALSRWDGTGVQPELPNAPVTPTLSGLSLDYQASAEFVPGDIQAPEALFVVEPWGFSEAVGETGATLVPDLDAAAAGEPPLEAALFVGLEALDPPATVSLLFQIDQGTATSPEILAQGETEWSYLQGATWETLAPESVRTDTTYGFQQPGLVVLAIGPGATTRHTTMPAGRVWLRAVIRRPAGSASRTRLLASQAAAAEFSPSAGTVDDYAPHLANGLPAETISRLQKRRAAVKSVTQPFASFGGRGAEPDAAFFQRTSERLRHRNRAVTAWDFERLVLEAFPEVFKVKCLVHSDADGNASAGETVLVIVPDLRSTENTNPLEPRAGEVLMSRIADFVAAGKAPGFAKIHVIHPVFEHILVDARVAFQKGLDPGFYTNQLNLDLQRFLSPWAFDDGQDIVFNARIYRSEVLAFMEGREYVDFITDFSLYHRFDGPPRGGVGAMTIGVDFVIGTDPTPAVGAMTIGSSFIVGTGVEVAETTQPQAILVSRSEHRIRAIQPGDDLCIGVESLGIGYLTVGLDFDIHPN